MPTLTATQIQIRGGHSSDSSNTDSDGFAVVGEKIVYSRFRQLIQRDVRMRNGKIVEFDLVGVKGAPSAVLVFAWDTKTKTATMIREYMPGPNKVLWGLAAGLVEAKHGNDSRLAAQHELEEECHLEGGEWHLLSEGNGLDKYATTDVSVYLVINPVQAIDPNPLDDEEDIEIVPGVTIDEIMFRIARGEMNVVGAFGALLAIEKLRELGEHPNHN